MSMGVDTAWTGTSQYYRQMGTSLSQRAPFTGNALADFLIGKFYNLEQGREYKTQDSISSVSLCRTHFESRLDLLSILVEMDPFFPYTDRDGKTCRLPARGSRRSTECSGRHSLCRRLWNSAGSYNGHGKIWPSSGFCLGCLR